MKTKDNHRRERLKIMQIKGRLLRYVNAAIVLALFMVAYPVAGQQQSSEADAVYKNGFVYTVDSVRSRAQAFAVRDGKFLKVGTNDDMKAITGPDTRVVDLKGKMVMPGLVDTHIHALRGALTALGLAFPVTSSVDEIKAAIKKYIADKKLKKGDWVEGGAPMIDAYATAPTFGTPSIDEATLSTWMLRFDKAGIKVMAHATGSLSARHFLNAV